MTHYAVQSLSYSGLIYQHCRLQTTMRHASKLCRPGKAVPPHEYDPHEVKETDAVVDLVLFVITVSTGRGRTRSRPSAYAATCSKLTTFMKRRSDTYTGGSHLSCR